MIELKDSLDESLSVYIDKLNQFNEEHVPFTQRPSEITFSRVALLDGKVVGCVYGYMTMYKIG